MTRISWFIFLSILLPISSPAQTTNSAIARATAAMEAARPRAQSDPAHPIFHITSPAQWMNDPNGPIFHKGFYHLFYQLNPFSDGDGPKYWGHVRSRDLVSWEPLPIALWPSTELGETGVWSGCCTTNGRGQPMIFYTSIAQGKSAFDHAEQWAATSDDSLIDWKKSPANPVLSEELHGGTKVYDWRDPFIFREHGKTFLVAGGHLEKQGRAAVNIYEALNTDLTKWTYRGVLFQLPDNMPTAECPNFFKLGNQWVLFISPYGKVHYFTGDFDAMTCRFQPHREGTLDFGSSFYAPNTMQLGDGRRLVWGWVNGFPGGQGWNGCLSLPRLLDISDDGQLLQKPAPQLSKLRGKPIEWRSLDHVASPNRVLTLPKTDALEIQIEVAIKKATLQLKFKSGAVNAAPMLMTLSDSEINMMGATAPLRIEPNQKLSLRIFIDHSVLEVFAGETVCITKVIPPLGDNATLEIDGGNGPATATIVRAWPMRTIWRN